VPRQAIGSAAQGLCQPLEPAACFRGTLATASGRAVSQRRAGTVEIGNPEGNVAFEVGPDAPDRGVY